MRLRLSYTFYPKEGRTRWLRTRSGTVKLEKKALIEVRFRLSRERERKRSGDRLTWLMRIRKITTTTSSIRAPWPLLASIGAFIMTFGGVGFMRYINGGSLHLFGIEWAHPWLFFIGLALILYVMFGWWADTVKEATRARTRASFRCTCATA